VKHFIQSNWCSLPLIWCGNRFPTGLCPVSANSIASQLMKDGAHKTGRHESSRFVNKELSDLWKFRSPEGNCISVPFLPEELAAALRRLQTGKSPGLDSIFPEFIQHAGSALKSWFCDFLPSCLRQKIFKDLEKSTNSCDPKGGKAIGGHKELSPYIISLLQFYFFWGNVKGPGDCRYLYS